LVGPGNGVVRVCGARRGFDISVDATAAPCVPAFHEGRRNKRTADLVGTIPKSGYPLGDGTTVPFARWSARRGRFAPQLDEECMAMLGWALTFLIVALIAAVLGFGGIAGFAVEIAKIIFFVAIVLFVISAVVGLARGRTPTVP